MAAPSTPEVLPAVPEAALPALAPAELEGVRDYLEHALAPATLRAYRAALRHFGAWCAERDLEALPAAPEALAAYLAAEAKAGRSVATLGQRLAALRWVHERAGETDPTRSPLVRTTMAGVRRALGVAPQRKAPATAERVAAMVAHADRTNAKGLRDRALLLLGFATAMRRSELVALEVGDLAETSRGLVVRLRRSKSDQEGRGHERAVPFGRSPETCPVAALRAWLEAAGIAEGPLFRSVDRHGNVGPRVSDRAVADIVKHYAKRAGLDPRAFGGHSLRAGFVTSAAERGARAERIADHTGHASIAMVRVYTRRVDTFADHPGEGLL
jgi:site-specific recombinase XerD